MVAIRALSRSPTSAYYKAACRFSAWCAGKSVCELVDETVCKLICQEGT